MKLFDPRPKRSRGELFDRVGELEALERHVGGGTPLVLVVGVRRIGKTSLLLSFLEGKRGVYVDFRGVETLAELYARLSQGLSSGLDRLRDALAGIRGVSVMGVEVSLKWRGEDSISLAGLMEEVDRRGGAVFVFDEVQGIGRNLAGRVKRALAYAYDNLRNTVVVLSGSEVGMLRGFVGIDDPSSPLYGRYMGEVPVERFSRDLSLEFLRTGFREAGVEAGRDVLEAAVDLFDGIPGWLVHFGLRYLEGSELGDIVEEAVALAAEELRKLGPRERAVLRAIAEGHGTWSSARRRAEELIGATIPQSSMTAIVGRLERLSIVRNYEFLDPIYRRAAARLRP